MAYAIQAFNTAILSADLSHSDDQRLNRHIGNAVRKFVNFRDDDGNQLWTIYKERPGSPHKIDAAMAAILSWEARRDALAAGVGVDAQSVYEERGVLML